MASLEDLKQFDLQAASTTLWTFKVSGAAKDAPRYNGRWVETSDEVQNTLRQIAGQQIEFIEETLEYSLTAQNNEASMMTLETELTHAGLLMDAASEELEDRKVTKVSEIQNSPFYAAKFTHNGEALFAVRKTGSGWKLKRANDVRRIFFEAERFTLDERVSFEIEKSFDLFIYQNTVFIRDKNRSESVLRYKQAHLDDFTQLQDEPEFAEIFSEMDALVKYIGNNKMQLRRAAAIRQKAHYKDAGFMLRLREKYGSQKLNLEFDDNGKILATEKNAADIMTALLDHRLSSVFSESVYDVQDTQPVD
ncbi:MAG: Kiwa anti-phage protein KwaB-like domain-containing protein [Pseudomonadota bacterium]